MTNLKQKMDKWIKLQEDSGTGVSPFDNQCTMQALKEAVENMRSLIICKYPDEFDGAQIQVEEWLKKWGF